MAAPSSKNDPIKNREARIQRIYQIADLLDNSMTVPGTRFRVGWDSVIGLVPGIGDLTSAAISGYLVVEAAKLGAPKWGLMKMLGNVGVDTFVGAIPIFGDLFDAAYRCNRRNARLLREHLESQTGTADAGPQITNPLEKPGRPKELTHG
ncbi:hypothetical protein KOR42_51850 [Thalassoglobus neptunius]|uniref:DUF4112 domain-containing protein n=1 Tax=Thalassoglobus neptunius TaxID=1938619 RepID=A0A5C5VI35_9PLAN|nr:DUF4112 domain-containing protein [Thalassoglobus neptunius]TWT38304.1 hypothetical protein KOR42_51850 [Thalassoglobus neptunius]